MKIVIGTGGSGGHLFPALRVAKELKENGHDIIFLGSFRLGTERIKQSGFAFEDIYARGLTTNNLGEMFSSLMLNMRAVVKSFNRLREIKPDSVVGFGGYGAFPVLFAAVILRYPTVIHEQNVLPGRANALLANFVKKIAVSFQKSVQYYRKNKTVLTGCPCHDSKVNLSREQILSEFGLKDEHKTILVVGGSQGSHSINKAFMETIKDTPGRFDIQVIHVCGEKDYESLNQQYGSLGLDFALYKFLDNIDYAYAAADLVISRAGAVTVTEIACYQLPSILIPYPYAHSHQKANALILAEIDAAILIEEQDLNPQSLSDALAEFLIEKDRFRQSKERLKEICFPDAAKRLAFEVTGILH